MTNLKPKVLFFAGSTRKESFNKKLSRLSSEIAQGQGIQATWIDLRDYPMPLYDGDLEDSQGLPAQALRLKKLMLEHDAYCISSPEYNSSISGVLKNTIDWISRPAKGVADSDPLAQDAFDGKVIALTSASPGGLGGIRGLVTVRSILGNMGSIVVPEQVCIAKAHEAFDERGQLKNERYRSSLEDLLRALQRFASRLAIDAEKSEHGSAN